MKFVGKMKKKKKSQLKNFGIPLKTNELVLFH